MINKSTVLILGAGSSMSFNFPSGEQLFNYICRIANEDSLKHRALFEFLKKEDMESDLHYFCRALFYSGKQSVDAFLEHRPDFLEVGKAAIASVLVPYERSDALFGISPNWYKKLYT